MDAYAQQWQRAEETAIREKIGLWKDPQYQVWTSALLTNNLPSLKHDFIVACGMVTQVKEIKNKIFINFGEDWQTDVTVVLAAMQSKETYLDYFKAFEGKTVIFRGWLEEYKGPYIPIYHSSHMHPVEACPL